jgi:coproporphyrinogen III oxidase-like Fe-S oxidoreductase
MVGNPEETVEKILNSIEFAKNLGLDFVQVCRTIAKPGTEFDKMIIKKPITK